MGLTYLDVLLLQRNDPGSLLRTDAELAGGLLIVANKAARDAVAVGSRALGMVVAWDETGAFVTKKFTGATTADVNWQNDANWLSLNVPAASETVNGIAPVATQAITDTGTDDATILSPQKLKAFPQAGFVVNLNLGNTFNPVNGTVYALRNNSNPPLSVFGTIARLPITEACILKGFICHWYAQTVAGSGEDVAMAIRLNNTTDVNSVTVGDTNALKIFSSLNGTQVIAAGDYIEMKLTCPAWVTPPTGVIMNISIFFSKY